MTKRVWVGCLVLVMAGSMWTIAAAGQGSPGQTLYDNTCRPCHGAEGRGAKGPALIPFEWSVERARDLIRQPVCDMPPIPESDLSDADIAQIVAYLKSIK